MSNFTGKIAAFAWPILLVAALAGVDTPQAARAFGQRNGDVLAAPPIVSGRDAGRVDPHARIDLTLLLRFRNEAELRRRAALVADPSSPQYAKFVDDAGFSARYGPTPATYARVERTLRSQGFEIVREMPDRTTLAVAAPAAAVERTFATELHRFVNVAGTHGFVNVRPATAPASLAADVAAVLGFDDVVEATHALVRAPDSRAASSTAVASGGFLPDVRGGVVYGPYLGYGPFVYANAYNFPDLVSGRNRADGKGRTAAVVIDAYPSDELMKTFFSYFVIPRHGPPTMDINIDGGPQPGANPSYREGIVEAYLDAETILGLAPGTQLDVYGVPRLTLKSVLDAYAAIVANHDSNRVDVVNSSFGACELAQPTWAPAVEAVALEGVVKGITFAAATGDSGARTCLGKGVSAPADVPNFTAVGGTSLLIDTNALWAPPSTPPSSPPYGYARYKSERGWSATDPLGQTGAGGGGPSALFPRPAYQDGVGTGSSMRAIPDVSFEAAPGSGEAIAGAIPQDASSGPWLGVYGGTSLSSPLFCALVVEMAQRHGHAFGNLDVAMYRTFESDGYFASGKRLFHDVTRGSNALDGRFPGYPAHKGYDFATGIGSIDGEHFSATLP